MNFTVYCLAFFKYILMIHADVDLLYDVYACAILNQLSHYVKHFSRTTLGNEAGLIYNYEIFDTLV